MVRSMPVWLRRFRSASSDIAALALASVASLGVGFRVLSTSGNPLALIVVLTGLAAGCITLLLVAATLWGRVRDEELRASFERDYSAYERDIRRGIQRERR